jgi:AhpD family alkylhydroperoxidase
VTPWSSPRVRPPIRADSPAQPRGVRQLLLLQGQRHFGPGRPDAPAAPADRGGPRRAVASGHRRDRRGAAGVLDVKTKELIALAVAVSKECDGCIAAHAHAAVEHGATPAEAAEAIGVTFLMNGGPATVYGARAFAAFREFYDQRAAAELAQPNGHQM